MLLGAVLAGVLATITGWTTGAINWAWNALSGDSSPIDVAKLPPVPEVSGYGTGLATAVPQATGNAQGSPTPLPEGGLAIANAYFSASEFMGAGHCTLYAVVPRPVSQVRPPRLADGEPDIASWGTEYDIGDPDVTTYMFTVSAKPGKTVTLTRAHTVYVSRPNRSTVGTSVSLHIGSGCGAGGEFRYFAANLDDPVGAWAPENDDKANVHEATNFPYIVKDGDPETFVLTARTVNCDCVWRIQLDWVSGAQTGNTIIDNGIGRNFHTIGSSGYTHAEWWLDYQTKRWSTTLPTSNPWQ